MIPEDAVTKAEVESVLSRIRQVRADLIRVERESGGSYDLCSVVRKLDEVIRRLNPPVSLVETLPRSQDPVRGRGLFFEPALPRLRRANFRCNHLIAMMGFVDFEGASGVGRWQKK